MGKIIKVSSCATCPYAQIMALSRNGCHTYACTNKIVQIKTAQIKIPDTTKIPYWCPLENEN